MTNRARMLQLNSPNARGILPGVTQIVPNDLKKGRFYYMHFDHMNYKTVEGPAEWNGPYWCIVNIDEIYPEHNIAIVPKGIYINTVLKEERIDATKTTPLGNLVVLNGWVNVSDFAAKKTGRESAEKLRSIALTSIRGDVFVRSYPPDERVTAKLDELVEIVEKARVYKLIDLGSNPSVRFYLPNKIVGAAAGGAGAGAGAVAGASMNEGDSDEYGNGGNTAASSSSMWGGRRRRSSTRRRASRRRRSTRRRASRRH